MKTATIGYKREDGSFRILATLNNNDDDIPQETFNHLIEYIKNKISFDFSDVEVLEREDAPDYIDL